MRRFSTVVLPPPSRTLRPKDALEWLHKDAYRLLGLVPLAREARSAEMEAALWSFALDLFVLVQACGEALVKGRAEVRLHEDPRLFPEYTRELELVLEGEKLLRRHGIRTAVRARLQRALRERRRIQASLEKAPARRQPNGSRAAVRRRARGRSPQRTRRTQRK